jgi:hypothetical protein
MGTQMKKASDHSFLTRLSQATGLSLVLMMASAAGVHAQVIGANGAPGANGVNPGDSGQNGGDGESVSGNGTVIGGNGGAGGNAAPPDLSGNSGAGGNGGNGGAAIATGADANAVGGNGGNGGADGVNGFVFEPVGGSGGSGGAATALATGAGSVSASATGGNGGLEYSQLRGNPGVGGDANATADASAASGGTAIANAVATGGSAGEFLLPLSVAKASSTATTSLAGVSVQSNAVASSALGAPETTLAVAQAGGGILAPPSGFEIAYAVSTIFPDNAYAVGLIPAGSNVADALLAPGDEIFGIAILGTEVFLAATQARRSILPIGVICCLAPSMTIASSIWARTWEA